MELFLDFHNFEDINTIIDEKMLRNWLIWQIPWPHIYKENTISLVYINQIEQEDGKTIRGRCLLPTEEGGSGATIIIYKQNEERSKNGKLMMIRHVIHHEIGHIVYSNLRQKAKRYWKSLMTPENSIYPQIPALNPEEEFAECYSHYIHQPDLVFWSSKDKYDFLKKEAFGGKEFIDYSIVKGGLNVKK